jgi:Bacterial membrane protein YfhO
LRAVAFYAAAGFNLRVQPTGSDNFAEKLFTPFRFGVLLALLVFATFPQVILGLETFVARDYGFFAYPLAHFQRECFSRGELPFWDPYNNCGVPFLAQWNTMPLYPPSLIYLALPLEWSLSFFCLLHLWFAGVGMFFLARRWTGNNFAAAFAGVAFSFNGFTLNLLMWPSHMATFAWMPWVVLAVELAWREGGKKIFLAGLAGAFQMLAGGPEIIFLTWVLLFALWVQQFVIGESPRKKMFWRFPLVIFLVIALSAAQLLPFLDLVAHSQRESGYADLRWSMPGWGWMNFLVPMVFGGTHIENLFFQYGQYWTSSYYLGIGALWLALLALWKIYDRRVWLFGGVAIVALIFALGENTPIYPALRQILPQLSFITYPVKYVAVVAFLAPLLAAFALTNLKKFRGKIFQPGAILLALIVVILFWAWRFPFPTDDVRATLSNGLSRAFFLILTGAVLFALTRETNYKFFRFAPLFLILTAWLDVFTHEPVQNPTVAPNIYEQNLARADLKMNPQPELGGSRAMVSPKAFMDFVNFALNDPKNNFLGKRLGYCANVNLLDAVPKVDGFFSLTPRESDEVLSLFYTRTNASYPRLEDFMGVSQITAPDQFFHWQTRTNFLPLVTAGQKPVFLQDTNVQGAFMRNNFAGGRIVFLPPEEKAFVTVSNQTAATILKSKFETQSADIEAFADEPSLVVVAQTYYHNWRAEIDGQPVKLLRANIAFQAVQIPPGRHQIRLFYRDYAFEIGAAISGAAWPGCLLAFLIRRRAQKF